MNRLVRFVIQGGMTLALITGLLAAPLQAVQAATPISLVVKSVLSDSKVTVVVSNLPVDETFRVRMGAAGLQGLDGSVVANFDTTDTSATTRIFTFEIPTILSGAEQIDLRIDGGGNLAAYTTFTNRTTNVVSTAGIGGIPGLAVLSVLSDSSVTVQSSNLPADTDFTVRMGAAGTQGLGGQVSAGFNSGAGGTLVNTFSIPESLIGAPVIDIRIDALGGYFASSSFNNAATVSAAPAGVGGASSILVNSVLGNSMVTITARNLPASATFTVRVGPEGSQGLGGNVVANFDSVAGGTVTLAVEIPTNLYGSEKLDVRVETAGNYAVYTTFSNVTTP